jgi:hypothetical protein
MEQKRGDAAGQEKTGPVDTRHAGGEEGNLDIIEHADSSDAKEREGATRKAAEEAAGGVGGPRDPAAGMPEARPADRQPRGDRSDERK